MLRISNHGNTPLPFSSGRDRPDVPQVSLESAGLPQHPHELAAIAPLTATLSLYDSVGLFVDPDDPNARKTTYSSQSEANAD
jgi:hypothetical protein